MCKADNNRSTKYQKSFSYKILDNITRRCNYEKKRSYRCYKYAYEGINADEKYPNRKFTN